MVEIIEIPNAWYESLPKEWTLSSDDISIGKGLDSAIKRIVLDEEEKSPIQDQYADWNYAACGAYSASHSTNVMNAEEWTYWLNKETTSTWKEFWEIQKNEYRGSDKYGSYQEDNINMLQKYGYIAGSYRCKRQRDTDEAIDNGFAISTGSKEIDWEKTRKNGWVAVRWEGGAHLFTIVGKDDDKKWYIVRDSWGKLRMNKWYFFVPYDMYDVLYTCYGLIDKKNQHIIDVVLANKELLKRVKSLGITNGNYLQAYAERRMAAIVFARVVKYPTTWYSDAELLDIARNLNIRSGQRPNDFVTRYEIALMASAVLWLRVPSDEESIKAIIDLWIMQSAEEKPILREHLVYVAMRIFDKKA